MRLPLRAAAMLGIVLADRATKYWAARWLLPRGAVPVLPFFHLTYVENTGAAFNGLGGRANPFGRGGHRRQCNRSRCTG